MSVPQIFIKQVYIGGADDLADMFGDERLATMLGRASL
jgi:glutaredoxin-related protein